MKTLLVHAPGDSPCDAPWMGVPALVAHLKKVGYTDTQQRDVDLDLYYDSQTPEALERMVRLFKENLRTMPKNKGKLWKRVVLRWFALPALKIISKWELRDVAFFEKFRNATPVGEQFPDEGKIRYRRTAQGILKMMAIWYYPYQSYPKFFSLRDKQIFWKLHLRLGHLLYEYLDLGQRALRAYYEEAVVPRVKDGDYDVVGISVSVQRQYDTAIMLAEVLREHNVRAKLVMGGSYISETYDADWLEEEIIAKFDYVVRYEGEDAIRKLLDYFEGKGELEDIPNLVYMSDGKRIEHKRDRVRDIDTFASPNYDDLPLDHYLDRPVRLPIMGNRGCYWAKCTFCAHFWSLGVGAMRDRSAVKLIGDVKELQAKYGVRHFFFADESIYPPTIEDFCDLVHEEGLDINWSGMIRFEECMTKEYMEMMKGAGCHMLLFGLESISQNVQDIIKKGVDPKVAMRVLKTCKEVGVNVHLFMILGTPGETKQDMEDNINFLLDNTDLYKTVQLAPFELTMGSPMTLKPERYGIANIEIKDEHGRLAFADVEFDRVEGLTNEEVARYVKQVETNPMLFKKDYWSGWGFQIYEPNGVHVDAKLRPKSIPRTDPQRLTKDTTESATVAS